MRLRSPSSIEIVLQLLLGCFLVLLVFDFANAVSAQSCLVPNAGAHCYPWGIREGPMADYAWSYASRETYLMASAIMIGALVVALLPAFLTGESWQGVLGMIAVPVAGGGCLAICERLLAPG